MIPQKTYGHLFAYLRTHKRTLRSPDPYFLVKRYLSENGIPAEPVIAIMEAFGGYDDVEVLLNVDGRISPPTLLADPVETPEEYATRNNLWLYGEDGWAYPDLNAALARMMEVSHG